jgi:hypothetical protein
MKKDKNSEKLQSFTLRSNINCTRGAINCRCLKQEPVLILMSGKMKLYLSN